MFVENPRILKVTDSLSIILWFLTFSDLVLLFTGYTPVSQIVGIQVFYILLLLFYCGLAVYLAKFNLTLDVYRLVRIFIPAYLVTMFTDILDIMLVEIFKITSVGDPTAVNAFGLLIFLPILSLLRMIIPILLFMFVHNLTLSFINRKSRYIKYRPTFNIIREFNDQN